MPRMNNKSYAVLLLTQSLMALTIVAALDDRDTRYVVERREIESYESSGAITLTMSVAHEMRSPVNVIQGLAGLSAERPHFDEHDR